MEITQRLENWTSTHHPAWFDIIRMALGIFLFVKGFMVLSQIASVQSFINNINLLNNSNVNWSANILAQIIAYTHIIGGLLIAIGLGTRPAIFFQIPILVGAVFFTPPGAEAGASSHLADSSIFFAWSEMDLTLEWWTAFITLVLLCCCFVMGSGPWSVDKYLQHYEDYEE
ncbi:MAG: DoxX family protein [Pyrinomonadaceae bacterium]|nr:DoxX family protein [Pyrinomonadaceae bacterium]